MLGRSMASCPSCGAEASPGSPCPSCVASTDARSGRRVGPSPERRRPPRRKQQKAPRQESPRGGDPPRAGADRSRESLQQPAVLDPCPAFGPPAGRWACTSAPAPEARNGTAWGAALSAPAPRELLGRDRGRRPHVASDASLLADHGEPPGHWLLSPFYAWRVLRKQREIKAALAGRREEAARAATALEDALVAFAERVKPAAQNVETYANLLAEACKADELLRSR